MIDRYAIGLPALETQAVMQFMAACNLSPIMKTS